MAIHTGSVGATFLSPGNSDGSKYIGHVAEESGRGRESSLAAGNYKMKFDCMFEKVSLYYNKPTQTQTCRSLSLSHRGERPIAEIGQTLSPASRLEVAIVTVYQDLPQSFTLTTGKRAE